MSHACNEFIIKENKFVRDFEGMYQAFEDPWDQHKKAGEDLLNLNALWILSKLFDQKKLTHILDVGTANGYYLPKLLELGDQTTTVTGIDISETVIERAKEKNKNDQIELICWDVRKKRDDFQDRFDLLFSGKTIYYLFPEIDVVLKNLSSFLKKDGLFCFTINTRDDAFSNQFLTYEALRQKLLDQNWAEVFFSEWNRLKPGEEKEIIGIYQKQVKK